MRSFQNDGRRVARHLVSRNSGLGRWATYPLPQEPPSHRRPRLRPHHRAPRGAHALSVPGQSQIKRSAKRCRLGATRGDVEQLGRRVEQDLESKHAEGKDV